MPPTKTIPSALAELIAPRQAPTATVTVTAAPSDSGSSTTTLNGGAIAGIVIGSVVGFLLILWIIRSCTNLGAPPSEREAWYDDHSRRHSHQSSRPHRHHHHHHHPRRTSSTSRPIVIEEKASSRGSRSPRHMDPAYVYPDSGRGRRGSGRYYTSY